KKGGKATSKSHDKDFYEKIGKKGGKANSDGDNN
ncbi:KGG domain-containing protein, partial [Lactobacillus helveticus]